MPTAKYTIDVATSTDHEKLSALRRAAFSLSKEFALHDIRKADWCEWDEASIVLTARLGDQIVSSVRITIFGEAAAAEAFLEYPITRHVLKGPLAVLSRAVTLPSCFKRGLNGALRYAYLMAAKNMTGTRIENLVAIVYQGGPRVHSMQRAGYVMMDCNENWDSEAELSARPLIAVLSRGALAQATRHIEVEGAAVIVECAFDWDCIQARFELAGVIST